MGRKKASAVWEVEVYFVTGLSRAPWGGGRGGGAGAGFLLRMPTVASRWGGEMVAAVDCRDLVLLWNVWQAGGVRAGAERRRFRYPGKADANELLDFTHATQVWVGVVEDGWKGGKEAREEANSRCRQFGGRFVRREGCNHQSATPARARGSLSLLWELLCSRQRVGNGTLRPCVKREYAM